MNRPLNTYERALLQLEKKLLQLGDYVAEQADKALEALKSQNIDLARQVVMGDDFADDLAHEIEMTSLDLISLQQPSGGDLRLLGLPRRALGLEAGKQGTGAHR